MANARLFLSTTVLSFKYNLLDKDHCIQKDSVMETINNKRKAKRTSISDKGQLLTQVGDIDKKYSKKPSIYAGSEEKLLNLVVKIIVKIILKEVL